jgi:ribosomal protein S18 acetylase RimI-like enzyme
MAWETEEMSLDSDKVAGGIQALFDDPAKGKYFIARIDNETVGCLMITFEWSEWRNASVIWIQSVYVKEKYRRKGVYRALYEHVKTMVRNSDAYQGIRLYVEQQNHRAQQVYKALGMTDEHYLLFEWMDQPETQDHK